MSRGFDETVERAWQQFERDLDERLEALPADLVVVGPVGLDESEQPSLRVQVLDDLVHVEAVRNLLGDRDHLFSAEQQRALTALGWEAPDHVDHPAWWIGGLLDDAESLCRVLADTWRSVFGVLHPGFLEVVDPGAPPPETGVDDVAQPDSREALVELVAASLVPTYGPDVKRDDDGDFPVFTGVVPVWIRVLQDRPVLRFFSHVVCDVGNPAQARIEIEILNRQVPLLKFQLAGDTVLASYELPADPFVARQAIGVLEQVSDTLNELATDLADRVGGQLFFDAVEEATDEE